MNQYLITGVAGTGKTTIAKHLHIQGHNALDMDRVSGLGAWIEQVTGKPRPKEFETAADWVGRYDWLWDEKRLHELLDSEAKPIFFCGSSTNQEKFYNLFTSIFLLEIDDETLKDRLIHGERDHEFGRRPGELEVILSWYKGFQERTKALDAIVINATKSIDQIVEEILAYTNDNQ